MTPLIKRSFMEHRPQEIGKIKLGGRGRKQKTSGGSDMYLPERYDHFEVVTRAREGKDGAFVRDEAVHKIVGDEPRELEGVLMFPEIEQNLMTVMAEYAGRKPKVICDGEVQRNEHGKESPCTRQQGGTCKCRPYGRLQLQLMASPHTGGYYVFRTRSWESVNNIQTALEEIHARFGTLFQAPVKLMAYQSEDQYQQDGKEMVGKSWKVALVLDMNYEQAAQHMVGAKERLELARERLMLTAGEVQKDLDETDEREAGEIADEFSPPKELEASIRTQEGLDEVLEGLEPVEPPEPPMDDPGEGSECDDDPESALREDVEEHWEAARALNLLDHRAEEFITDALAQGGKPMEKALKALQRKLDEFGNRGSK
jgi:hypothetical protein